MTSRLDTLIACVAVGWACGALLRDLLRHRPTPTHRPKTVKAGKARKAIEGRVGPITVDEAYSLAWEINRESDLIARLERER